MASDNKFLTARGANVSVAPMANGVPDLANDNSNADIVWSYINTNFAFTRLFRMQDAVGTINTTDNLVNVEFDDCDVEPYTSTRPVINFSGTWYEALTPNAKDILLGTTSLNVASTPVAGATQNVINPDAYDKFIIIANQNGDGSAITVNSVTASVDGALVDGTDYRVVQNAKGEYGIQIVDSVTVTTLTQTFTIDYDYTPNATIYHGIKSDQRDLPKFVLKIETCPDANGLTDTYYITDMYLNGDLSVSFIDATRTQDLAGSAIAFVADKGGQQVSKNDTLV